MKEEAMRGYGLPLMLPQSWLLGLTAYICLLRVTPPPHPPDLPPSEEQSSRAWAGRSFLLLGPLGNASRPPYDPGPQLEPSQAGPRQTPLVGATLVAQVDFAPSRLQE